MSLGAISQSYTTGALSSRAPGKINLTLHIRGRQEDGFHVLDSLVVFSGLGDILQLLPDRPLSFFVEGPTARAAGNINDNLVLKAVRSLQERRERIRLGAFQLTKKLPVAAGIGGGSSDAAAALRLLSHINEISLDDPILLEAACAVGSDVLVCLDPQARYMSGTGNILSLPVRLPTIYAVLVNPRVEVPTSRVFQSLGMVPGTTINTESDQALKDTASLNNFYSQLMNTRNDLQEVAIKIAPVIRKALEELEKTQGCKLVRMSGSGATVFGLFSSRQQAAKACLSLRSQYPTWWVHTTLLR